MDVDEDLDDRPTVLELRLVKGAATWSYELIVEQRADGSYGACLGAFGGRGATVAAAIAELWRRVERYGHLVSESNGGRGPHRSSNGS